MGLRRLGLVVLALGAIVCAGYWGILAGQPARPDPPLGPFLVTALIIGPAAACAAACWRPAPGRLRLVVLAWSSLTLLTMSLIAAASIGIAVLPVAMLAVAATVLGARRPLRLATLSAGAGGAVLGLATVVAFLSAEPFLPPGCPNSGSSSGEADWPAGLLTPAVHQSFTCRDGRLVNWTTTPVR